MVETQSAFRGVLDFFFAIGIYDVVLPFLLVFTIMFAVLDKTKVLGVDEYDGKKYPRRNLNAMVAFVSGFLFIASTRLVSLINQAVANIVILVIFSVLFLVLIGVFYSEKEEVFLGGWQRMVFVIIMFVGIVLIFLYAIPTDEGEPWLMWFWNDYLAERWDTKTVGSVILMIVIVVFMFYIVREPPHNKSHGIPSEKK